MKVDKIIGDSIIMWYQAIDLIVNIFCIDVNAHCYGNFTPLPTLPVVHHTWATTPIYPEVYVCDWIPNPSPITYY